MCQTNACVGHSSPITWSSIDELARGVRVVESNCKVERLEPRRNLGGEGALVCAAFVSHNPDRVLAEIDFERDDIARSVRIATAGEW